MKLTILIILLSILLSTNILASSSRDQYKDKKYIILLGPVRFLTDSLNEGLGTLFTREIIKRLRKKGYKFELKMYPWARANLEFNTGKADVLFPELIKDDSQEGMTGMPILMTNQAIFTLKTSPKLDFIKDLNNRNVVMIRGIMKPPELQHHKKSLINLIEVDSVEQAYQMLESKRAYGYINWIHKDNYNLPKFHIGKSVLKRFTAYRFQISTEGAKLMESFNFVIAETIKDGTYDRVFEEYKFMNKLMTSNIEHSK
ncbi:substrate-binding periplasmic protein [Spartinivicinus ruber]|uniref:substrate-binding periplasmic protein n=1 Tax=Spartinivicinus ruber TaxID=2683272 RepID=UPI0013D64BD8|nr:transporter substrate-binding domain-containing protein [Spartinivicinus ruber]